ncbi:MAG: threonine--tRNA ligase [Proteobacteria bacterium]|nr:threonine--tRNA ligase [Pseudomonadota bacterium]
MSEQAKSDQSKRAGPKDDSKLYRIRHSMAHVLAQAVQTRYPTVKLGFGPPVEHGFYYDFDFGGAAFHETDLKELEKQMRKVIGQAQPFARVDCNHEEAIAKIRSHRDEPFKIENLENLHARGEQNFSFYTNGNFLDLCEGPHVENTKDLQSAAFKLDRVAGAYWLGDEKRPMLTRIYALCFEKSQELEDFLKRRKMAEEFDHKKLGKELDLFEFDDLVGKGLPLWLPNGAAIRNEIQKFAEEMEFQYGYKRVATPNIAKGDLYLKSQHLPAYEESMFPPMIVKDSEGHEESRFYLKPMNCPHHHLIFSSRMRSYRDLPLRLAEYGTCYRYEQSGELSGLIRVRCMTMNDAHIYLKLDQFEDEFRNLMKMFKEFYDTFKFKDYRIRLSAKGDANAQKFKGDEEMWANSEKLLAKILDDLGIDYFIGEGEAAFYGPKVDFQFRNLLGREETVSTIQIDFLSPKNFDLKFTEQGGGDGIPVIIHRSPLSTHERFVSYLIEYYGGAFPTWCAPVQVNIVPVNAECEAFCKSIVQKLHGDYIRVEMDTSDNSLNKKIRNSAVRKMPITLIIGSKEVEENKVTVRRYGIEKQEAIGLADFYIMLHGEIKSRTMLREPMSAMI